MTLLVGYCIGVLIHITAVILGYIGAKKEQTFRNYFTRYTPLVLRGALFDVVIFAAWKIGVLPYAAGAIGLRLPEGLVLAEHVDVYHGLIGGFFADWGGKTFMPAFMRFLTGVVTRFGKNGKNGDQPSTEED